MANTFNEKIRVSLSNPNLQVALDSNAERRLKARLQSYTSLPEDIQVLRRRAHAVRAETITHLDQHLETFIRHAQANGLIVHRARDVAGGAVDVAIEPELPEALAARARLYYVKQEYDRAIEYARKAIERKPDCEGAYTILGKGLFASDRWQEAAALVDRALEANGEDYNVYIPFGNVLRALGDETGALRLNNRLIAVLEHQLEMVPEDVRARILLAAMYAKANRGEAAVRELERAVAMRPNDSNTLYNAACTYGVLQMKPETLAMFRRSVEAGFGDLDLAARDSDLACIHGDPEFQKIIESHRPTA